jgi:hypothetical protein
MHQEIGALKRGLAGQLRIAVIPTALAIVASLTTPFRARRPEVDFTIASRTSLEVLAMLENPEPIERACQVPLHREHYRLITAADSPFGNRTEVT